MKKAIVTGAAGFVGSNLCLELERRGWIVVGIDDLKSGTIMNLRGFKGEFVTADIREVNWNEVTYKNTDVIFHMAALSDTRETDENSIMEINYDIFKEMVACCEVNNVKLVYASSAATYGKGKAPMKETDKPSPLNPYGVSKLFMETYAEKSKAKTIGLRYFNIYGPREFHKKDYASMITQMYKTMKTYTRPKLFTHGQQKRDQVYVKDVVNATILAAEANYKGVLNIGSGQATTFKTIFDELNKLLDAGLSQPDWIQNPYPFYQDHTEADISLAKLHIGYVPQWPFKKGIKDYVKWLEENE